MIQERKAIQRLVDANMMGVLVSNLDGQIIEANDAFLDMLGYTRDDPAAGRLRWTEFTPAESRPASLRAVGQIRATGRSELYEIEYLRKDGSRVPVLVGSAAFEGTRGETVSFVLDLTERKRAEAGRRSEKELGAAIETIPAMVWSAWPDGHADFFNRRWQEYTGLSLEQSLGWDWGATVHPEDAEQYFGKWRECIASGQPIETEVRFRRAADGEYRWFLDTGVPLRDEQGNVLKWYGVVTDIDDRKRAEALLAGEKRILEMVARGDSLGRILEALCRLVEEQAPRVLASVLLVDGNRLRHGGAPSLPKAYTDAIDGLVIGPQVGSCGTAAYRAEQVIVCDIATDPLWADYRDAALRHGLRACWSTPVFSSEGKVIATFAMYYREARSPGTREQQIIEQIGHLAGVAIQSKAAEEELKKRAALLNLAHDAIIVRDTESRIVFWTPGAEKTYGWTAQEAIGRVSHELLQTQFPASREDVDGVLQEKGEWEGELRHITRHGKAIVVTSRQSLRRDEHGAGATILEINRDLTERKQAEEALHQAQVELAHVTRVTAMGELTASIAHEINQPLAAIIANANAALHWLAGQPPDLDEARETFGRMARDARRAGEVVGRVRALFKKTPTVKARVDMNDLIRDSVALVHAEVRRNRTLLQTELAHDLPPVTGDRVQLQQVILNLVLNGVDALKEVADRPRELLITSRPDEAGQVLVAVQDSGVGLDPQSVERVFEAFYTTKAEGMGMGLAICRSIIEAHGGRLWAEAKEPQGAVFQFILPPEGEESVAAEHAGQGAVA